MNDTLQPILDEAQEFRREADRRRARAISRIDEVDSHIETHKAILQQLLAERQRLVLLTQAAESVLTIIELPAPALVDHVDDEHSTSE